MVLTPSVVCGLFCGYYCSISCLGVDIPNSDNIVFGIVYEIPRIFRSPKRPWMAVPFAMSEEKLPKTLLQPEARAMGDGRGVL